MAIYTCSQLFKSGMNATEIENTTLSWSCVKQKGAWVIPASWIQNRNARRNLPAYWYNAVFTGTEQVPGETTLALIQRFTS